MIGVACGDGQTIAVSAEGRVFGWGCYKDKEGNPTHLARGKVNVGFYIGKKWFNSSQDDLFIRKQQDTPLLIEGLSGVVEVACGSAFSLARCEDGDLYSWGLGECGELGRQVGPMKNKSSGDYDEHVAKVDK